MVQLRFDQFRQNILLGFTIHGKTFFYWFIFRNSCLKCKLQPKHNCCNRKKDIFNKNNVIDLINAGIWTPNLGYIIIKYCSMTCIQITLCGNHDFDGILFTDSNDNIFQLWRVQLNKVHCFGLTELRVEKNRISLVNSRLIED